VLIIHIFNSPIDGWWLVMSTRQSGAWMGVHVTSFGSGLAACISDMMHLFINFVHLKVILLTAVTWEKCL
jgi:hypothetical protein